MLPSEAVMSQGHSEELIVLSDDSTQPSDPEPSVGMFLLAATCGGEGCHKTLTAT